MSRLPRASNSLRMSKPHALFFLSSNAVDDIYGPEERADLAGRVQLANSLVTEEIYQSSNRSWPGTEMIFAGWGITPCDSRFLTRFPDLKIIFYGSGTIRSFVTEAFWDKGIRVTSGATANAIPVSEYALSQILFGLKQGWQKHLFIRRHSKYPPYARPAGAYGSTVGLIALGMIGRLVAKQLRSFDLHVIAYDPFVNEAEAARQGVELVSLEELFRRSDVVSCHAPDLRETKGMITSALFAAMKPGATFLNTSRGMVVDEAGMVDALKTRTDLVAVLDVTHPEPPPPSSPLHLLENIIITPHIAGSMGHECRRMGRLMVEELDLYLAGMPLQYEIQREQALLLA
jgi:phosphoglycerate dehydrogenase-like enzyme